MAVNVYDVLNTARVEGGYEERIPEINQTNLHELSLLPPETLNDFINVITKIVKQYVYDTTFDSNDNPFASFYGENLPVGSTVEDLYVDLITGDIPAWNDDGSFALSKKLPNVKALYHSINYEMQYKASTSFAQMKSAFLTEGGVNSLINRINGTINSSAQYDLYLECLNLISTAVERGAMKIKGGYSLSSESGIKAFVKDLKLISKDMTFMTDKYNYFGFTTKTKKSDIVIITKPSVLETINVDYLAGVFNMEKTDIKDRIIEVPDDYGFGALDNEDSSYTPLAIIMDKRMLRIFPTLYEGSSIYNPASLVTNTFLTLQYIFSYGLFFNAVCLIEESTPVVEVTNSISISGLTVTPTDDVTNGDYVEVKAVNETSGQSAKDYKITAVYYSGYEEKTITDTFTVEAGDTNSIIIKPDIGTVGLTITADEVV